MDFRFFRQLWYFLAVADERNFSRAAARLGMSQPPLSQQIRNLERSLGVSLFERSSTGVSLTQEGSAILPIAQKLAAQSQRVEAIVREARAGTAGAITIGTITSAMFEVLPRFIRRLKRQYPDLTISLIEMDTSVALSGLESGEIDLAFVRSLHGGGRIRSEPIITDRLVVALPVEHPLAKQQQVSLPDLAGEAMVLFPRHVSPAYFDGIVSACWTHGFSPRILHEVRSVPSQVGLVACGIGVALVPEGVVQHGVSGVVFKPLIETVTVLTTCVSWHIGHASPLILNVVDLARSEASTSTPMSPSSAPGG